MPKEIFTSNCELTLAAPPAASGKTSQVDYFDRAFPGFGLRVTSNGARTWFLFKRLDGRVRRWTVGAAPRFKGGPGLSLNEARKEAVRMMAMLECGTDPARAGLPPRIPKQPTMLDVTPRASEPIHVISVDDPFEK